MYLYLVLIYSREIMSLTNTELEEERIEMLQKYEILNTPPDGSFDGITKLVAQLLKVPISVVSLVDSDRVWFKSKYGLEMAEVPRYAGFCSSAIEGEDIYTVEDTWEDSRTKNNPLVTGEPGLRFYSAAPLKTKEGYNLGTLCVMGPKPRKLKPAEKQTLQRLADLVMSQIEVQLEAKKAIRLQHEILSTTAHDLKNPISIMPLLADLIMANKENPAAIDDISKQIKAAGRRMANSINSLIENALENSEKMHLKLEAFDLSKLVKGITDANKALARKKGQKLIFKDSDSCKVYADKRRITEAVDNLINNAIKFSGAQKKTVITLKREDGKAVLKVKDEGPGMTIDDKKNLFRRFVSLSAEPTGGESSTGLGLCITKEIIDAHNGKIKVESEGKGRGTCFTMELALAEEGHY